jgi:hypothetical protein
MSLRSAPTKDPDATLDYTRTWSGWLQTGEEIVTSEWFVTGDDAVLEIGIDEYAPTSDATTATVWLIGGTEGATYVVTNRITTDNVPPRTDDRSFSVYIGQR